MTDLEAPPIRPLVEDFRPGYPMFSALLAAHRALSVFRRFSKLRARIILRKQDQLSRLENELERLDQEEPVPLYLASYQIDKNQKRLDLYDKLEQRLKEYDGMMEGHSRSLNAKDAKARVVSSLRKWLRNNPCLAVSDSAYLSCNDLFDTNERDDALAQVEDLVEDFMVRYFASTYKKHCTDQTRDRFVYLASETWLGRLARILIAVVVIFALLVPILICSYIESAGARIGIVCVAIVICITSLVTTVQIRTIEVVIAGTTYATVLTVFVAGNGLSV